MQYDKSSAFPLPSFGALHHVSGVGDSGGEGRERKRRGTVDATVGPFSSDPIAKKTHSARCNLADVGVGVDGLVGPAVACNALTDVQGVGVGSAALMPAMVATCTPVSVSGGSVNVAVSPAGEGGFGTSCDPVLRRLAFGAM